MADEKTPKARKAKARHRDVVIGGIEEVIRMLPADAYTSKRLLDLIDELRRANGGKDESE